MGGNHRTSGGRALRFSEPLASSVGVLARRDTSPERYSSRLRRLTLGHGRGGYSSIGRSDFAEGTGLERQANWLYTSPAHILAVGFHSCGANGVSDTQAQ